LPFNILKSELRSFDLFRSTGVHWPVSLLILYGNVIEGIFAIAASPKQRLLLFVEIEASAAEKFVLEVGPTPTSRKFCAIGQKYAIFAPHL